MTDSIRVVTQMNGKGPLFSLWRNQLKVCDLQRIDLHELAVSLCEALYEDTEGEVKLGTPDGVVVLPRPHAHQFLQEVVSTTYRNW
ncbi:hypothetical protein [Pseudohoeflea coraliihabitans]|uniref:Uncharacterized protein n=1 Tax=Pseudohoeflea coraliihabitans TaxID=2860393 RepID=A0ABS6WTK0_9HYPH|nr:hypothetical protein [Pseudohoeflea sp. DP4N28-3]MBW3099280.1 hypothetical protein [Pseudohoeflea sp. DP4N28-3]